MIDTSRLSFSAEACLRSVPNSVIHGMLDTFVSLETVRQTIQKLFTNVRYYLVEDDHRLHKSVHELDWNSILE